MFLIENKKTIAIVAIAAWRYWICICGTFHAHVALQQRLNVKKVEGEEKKIRRE